jgi:hypothetical protein
MQIHADTHFHVYPGHAAVKSLRSASTRLVALGNSQAILPMLFMTEGQGHHFFRRIQSGDLVLGDGTLVHAAPEPEALRVVWPDAFQVWIFAGRQIVTAERLEILALTSDMDRSDGQPAVDVLEDILSEGSIPVLPWAPGKWMYKRSAAVAEILERFGPDQLLMGDTSLRPLGWPTPAPMRAAHRRIVCGSDPLPPCGEEEQGGRYGTAIEGLFDPLIPVSSVRKLLQQPYTKLTAIGKRNSLAVMMRRLYRHSREKRK